MSDLVVVLWFHADGRNVTLYDISFPGGRVEDVSDRFNFVDNSLVIDNTVAR